MQFYNKILLLQIQPYLHLNGVGWGGLPSAIQQPHISRRLLQGEKKQATSLKGHGNETDFLGFLQKSVRQRFLTLYFELFRFGLHIHGDIRNRKTTPRLAESGSRQECL
jgi:hypothetical protein